VLYIKANKTLIALYLLHTGHFLCYNRHRGTKGVIEMLNNTSKVSNVSFRIDTDVKNQADMLFAQLGMNMTTAFNIFLRQAVREGGIPFAVSLNKPNATTIAAMIEAEQLTKDPNTKRFKSVDELFEELDS
jgi:DNA-damage-inducible protein J